MRWPVLHIRLRALSSTVERPLCRRKVAGSNPAESTKLLKKKFYQEAEGNLGGKPASGVPQNTSAWTKAAHFFVEIPNALYIGQEFTAEVNMNTTPNMPRTIYSSPPYNSASAMKTTPNAVRTILSNPDNYNRRGQARKNTAQRQIGVNPNRS